MKLTRRQALEKCRARWVWVSEDKNRDKRDWPGGGGRSCEACSYHKTHGEKYCYENCIIKWHGGNCLSSKSPFRKWRDAWMFITGKDCPKYALEIVKLCDEALERLPKRKKK